jgi:hypothetical protein
MLLLSSSPWCSLLQLVFYFKCKVFHTTTLLFVLLLLVCCYLLKNLVLTPCIPSCKNWEWLGVNNWKLVFFSKYFSLCLFSLFFKSHVFCSLFVLIFLVFGLWCSTCYKLFWKQT